jgi:glutamate racemase
LTCSIQTKDTVTTLVLDRCCSLESISNTECVELCEKLIIIGDPHTWKHVHHYVDAVAHWFKDFDTVYEFLVIFCTHFQKLDKLCRTIIDILLEPFGKVETRECIDRYMAQNDHSSELINQNFVELFTSE